MAARDAIVAFLDDLLEPEGWDDYGPNGLQVPGATEVETVVTGVSAHRELFELAVEAGAQLVLCHHGLFWGGGPSVITTAMRERLCVLFDADASLVAYHLPLDAHPVVGNNALLCEALGFERGEPFGIHRGRPIGFVGRAPEGVRRAELAERCAAALGRDPLVFDHGPDPLRTLGIVSGGGASSFGAAVELGLDGLLTGEPEEWAMADAREAGVNFFAAGHYATETLGVRRLGELLERELGVSHRFIPVPNPV